jgi:hypothetical protein
VSLVQVDVAGAQPSQAVLTGAHDPPPGQAGLVRVGAHREPALGRQDEPVPCAGPAAEPAADDLLGRAGLVDIGRVDEVAAGFGVPVEQQVGGRLVGLLAEGHGAQGKFRDDEPAPAQWSGPHDR